MGMFAIFKQPEKLYSLYARFELLISVVLLIFVSILIICSIIVLGETLFVELTSDIRFTDTVAIKDVFGLVLSILIMVEFNHSIIHSMRQHIGVIQVRVIVMIAVIVIIRKLILLDYSAATSQTLLALGGLALVLGVLYWLLSDIDRRRRAAGLPEE